MKRQAIIELLLKTQEKVFNHKRWLKELEERVRCLESSLNASDRLIGKLYETIEREAIERHIAKRIGGTNEKDKNE